MARTLSDTVIISMIEAATRLAAGRGPISGSGGQGPHPAGAHAEAGGPVGQETGATTDAAAEKPAAGASATSGQGGARSGSDEHDTRTADQIGSDFKAIYLQIEEVVKASAE